MEPPPFAHIECSQSLRNNTETTQGDPPGAVMHYMVLTWCAYASHLCLYALHDHHLPPLQEYSIWATPRTELMYFRGKFWRQDKCCGRFVRPNRVLSPALMWVTDSHRLFWSLKLLQRPQRNRDTPGPRHWKLSIHQKTRPSQRPVFLVTLQMVSTTLDRLGRFLHTH